MELIYVNNKQLMEKIYVKYDGMTEFQELNKNKRTLLSCFFQIIENHILYITYSFLKNNGVIDGTKVGLEYDGLCVPKFGTYDKETILKNLNNHILKKTNLRYILFKIKGYNDALDDIIELRIKMNDDAPKSVSEKPLHEVSVKTNTLENIFDGESNDTLDNTKNVYVINEEHKSRMKLYLNCISEKRYANNDDLFIIGVAIYNERCGFDLFDNVSKTADDYDAAAVAKKWEEYKNDENKYENKKATILSIIDFAKEDDIVKYKSALIRDKHGLMNQLCQTGLTDTLCAMLFYSKLYDKYIYDPDNKLMYFLNKYGIYTKDVGNIQLQTDINTHVYNLIENELMQRTKTMNEDEKAEIEELLINYQIYLDKNANKKYIANELKLLYTIRNLYEKLDTNDDIFAFTNGVYDLKNKIFRNGLPQEYITCTAKYEFAPADKDKKIYIMGVIESIMPDTHERIYLLKTLAIGLVGNNKLEEFYMWIGKGSNGKSMLRDLIKMTFGDYFDNMEIEYLNKTKTGVHSGAADPIMAKKKNSRIVISTEPEGDVVLKSAKIKQIVGRDPVQVRDLYQSSFNFVPKFKLIIQTNNYPKIDGFDAAIKRRLRVVQFPSIFVDNPKHECEKKIDRDLKDNLHNYKNEFFEILLDHYCDFINNDNNCIKMPKRFEKDTKNYLLDNDPIQDFIDTEIIMTNDKKNKILSSILYSKYTDYIGFNDAIGQTPFKNIMINKGFEYGRTSEGVCCFKIKLKGIEMEKEKEKEKNVKHFFGKKTS